MGGHLDNNAAGSKTRSGKIEDSSALRRKTHPDGLDLDLTAEESTVTVAAAAVAATTASSGVLTGDDGDVPRYHIPYPFAFNGGKPFSLEKDPITGKIDFEKAPPVRALDYADEREDRGAGDHDKDDDKDDGDRDFGTGEETNVVRDNDDVGRNEIAHVHAYTPNFHDFLNLPVHYSSDKYGNDKYPLISSSYANTKVQSGANSYSTYNHRPHHPGNDLYARPIEISRVPMTKTSTYSTTTVADFVEAKWTSQTATTAPRASTANDSSRSTPVLSTAATPIVTTWKPSSTPLVFHSIDRTGIDMETDDEKNLLPIERLHATAGSRRRPSNANDDTVTMDKVQAATRYKDQSSQLDNFVPSREGPGTKEPPLAQSEEYRDAYDAYESPDSEEEGESEGYTGDEDGKETDYFLPFRDLLKEDITSSTTISPTTTSTSTTTTATTVAASSVAQEIATPTVAAASSALPTLRGDVFAMNPPHFHSSTTQQQRPGDSASLNVDRRQSVATAPKRYDGTTVGHHAYKSGPMIKPEPNRQGIVLESTSNIVIPPDQDTVSFVLGNRQNVDGDYYSIGAAVGDNPYGALSDVDASFWSPGDDSHGPANPEIEREHLPPSPVVTEFSPDRVVQKWWTSAGSSALKSGDNELDSQRPQNALIVGTRGDTAPHSSQNNQSKERDSGYVAFPDDEATDKDAAVNLPITGEHRIVIVNEADGSVRYEIPPRATLATATTMTSTATTTDRPIDPVIMIHDGNDGNLPQLAEDLLPPAESSRPPSYYHHYQFDTLRPDHPRPQRLPLPPARVKPHSQSPPAPPLDVGLRKRPYPSDTKLPNILPQFRPNAKASHGHRGPDMIGTMPAGHGPSTTRIRQPPSRRPPPPASYLQRLNPPPPPIHAVRLALVPTSKTDSVVVTLRPHETEPTIRRFRPPHVSPISRGGSDDGSPTNRLFGQDEGKPGPGREVINERKNDPRDKIETADDGAMAGGSERYPEDPPVTPPRPPLFPKRRTADHPRVTTLQMIQHHGELTGGNESDPMESVLPLDGTQTERRRSDNHDPSSEVTNGEQPPVYVVYPVNTAVNIHPDDSNERDGSVVVGTRGPHRPLPPETLLQDETASEKEHEHTVYNGRPVAPDFPYPLERPDPSSVFSGGSGVKETPLLVPSEQRQQVSLATTNDRDNGKTEQDAAMNVIPYLQDFLPYRKRNDAVISVTLHRTASPASTATSAPVSTPTPIAYVYTPTHASAHRFDDDDDDNDATATVLLPSQQPSSSSSSAPAPQNFMAPFVASLSAEAPSKNGWSVVVVEPSSDTEKRPDSDSDEAKSANSEIDAQTGEKSEFDADNFKPQLFGGFKPIYEFPTEVMERDTVDADTEIDIPGRTSKMITSVPDEG